MTTQNPAARFLYVLISFLLQNSWRYLPWEYVMLPRRGARHPWSWQFGELLCLVRRAAKTALAVRRAVPANHRTTVSSGNPPTETARLASGDTVASAAERRRLRQVGHPRRQTAILRRYLVPISPPNSRLKRNQLVGFVRCYI